MAAKPPARKIHGIRSSIPAGYVLGRISGGEGDVELLTLKTLQSAGLAPTSLPPSGAAGGDLSGTYPNPVVAKLQTRAVSASSPSNLDVLGWNNAGSTWAPLHLATVAYSNSYLDLSNLPPLTGGTTGQVLTKTSAVDYAFNWQTPSGGSGGAGSAMDDGTNFYLAMLDGAGQLILDVAGDPIFALEVLPPAALPLATAAAVGGVKVDNSTIQAVLGILSTLFNGLYLTLSAVHNYTAGGSYQKALYDAITLDSQGAYSAITGKFTPTKAGKYLVFCVGQAQAFTSVTQANMIVSKNGTIGGTGVAVFTVVVGVGASSSDSAPMTGLGLVAMNGTTDFLELDFFIAGTGGSLALKQASTWGALYVGA